MANPEEFFLPEKPGAAADFRGPTRTASALLPIIDGSSIFEDQEKAISNANKSVFISSWAFNPSLPVTNRTLRKSLPTWGRLLVSLARKNVPVHLLVSDFDPVFRSAQHREVWLSYSELAAVSDALNVPDEMLQMVVSRHEAEWDPGSLVRRFLEPIYEALRENLNKTGNESLIKFMPGLWNKIEFKSGIIEWQPPDTIHPILVGSLHQKLIIVDEKIAYVSGINHVAINLDNSAHTLLSRTKKWHDGSVRVSGEILVDLVKGAFGTWNEERVKMASFVEQARKAQPRLDLPVRKTLELKPSTTAAGGKVAKKAPPKGSILCQAWRTVSRKITSSDEPDTICSDLVEGCLNAIKRAEKFIYIENQYLRDDRIGQGLVDRLTAAKDLNVIVVLPFIAEEMMGAADPISVTGVQLQFLNIERLQAFGGRFGAFALLAPIDPPRQGEPFKDVIYVHNKLMIVDDAFATLGSANLNQRSTKLDLELNLAWHAQGSPNNCASRCGKRSSAPPWISPGGNLQHS